MATVSRYFQAKGGNKEALKRKQSSTSSASDSGLSPKSQGGGKTKQDRKKHKADSEQQSDENMESDTIQDILKTLCTKNDIQELKESMAKMATALAKRVDVLEGTVFNLESENEKLTAEVNKLKGENKDLHGELKRQEKETAKLKREVNDNEQHGRQWNVRVFGVAEKQGETAEDCIKECLRLFHDKVGVKSLTRADIDIAHRTGKRVQNGKPRPLILRFVSRSQRGMVLADRRKLKGTGFTISEDLTAANYQLLKRVADHSATLTTWSSNGKIITKLKNGKIIKLDIDSEVDAIIRREMI